jgi:hypothetical protein
MDSFDPISELARLRQQDAITRKTSYRRRLSRLDHHTNELLGLHNAGASTAEIQRWLRREQRITVVFTTVSRWLAKHTTKPQDPS